MLRTPAGESLRSWYESAVLEHHGAGCEAEVYVARQGEVRLKVKRFRRTAELERHVLGAVLLQGVLEEMGWDRWLKLPKILGVDAASRTVVSPFVERLHPDPGDEEAWTRRAKAVMVLVCAAGRVADLSPAHLSSRAAPLREYGLEPPASFHLGGADIGGDNLIYEGVIWHAVDF